MANRVQIPISFSFPATIYVATAPNGANTTQESLLLPAAGSTVTVTNRVTSQVAIVYAAATGSSPISPVITDSGGNVPGYVVEGSYTIAAAAQGGFTGASVNWEAIYGAGVGNVATNAVDTPQLSSTLQTNLSYYTPPAPIGVLMHYAGSADPIDADGIKRWMICDGRSGLSQTTNPGLWNAIGATYGGTSVNFNLPDLRGRVAVGAGTGTGLTNRTLGSTGGEENHTLTAAQSGVNSSGSTQNGNAQISTTNTDHLHGPTVRGNFLVTDQSGVNGVNVTQGGTTLVPAAYNWGTGSTTFWMDRNNSHSHTDSGHGHGLSARDADTAHNNMQPYLVVNHIIRVL